ncbi:hypothetical protein K1719_026230 [Acacia pycnantha]|nr:hypothetical protein K1719_026230 [Acacia pycnantha]
MDYTAEMSPEAQDLIDRLLTEDPSQRLGAGGASEVKQHIFFKDINWDTLARQKPDLLLGTSLCREMNGGGGLTEFESGSYVNYSFSNFSFKNLSQLASISTMIFSPRDTKMTHLLILAHN